jgi:hypothetical protein
MLMKKYHQIRQVFVCKIAGPKARIEFLQSKVDGIGAIGYGGAGALPRSGWGEQFQRGRAVGGW